jgi:very-short-patch-repair endonuclease
MGKLGGFERLAEDEADFARSRVLRLRDMAVGDSPIEQLFHAALFAVAARGLFSINAVGRRVPRFSMEQQWDAMSLIDPLHSCAVIEPQVTIAGWRVDFVIHYWGYDPENNSVARRIIVECDGHDFHERTKAQAARDRSRDRAAQHEGIPIYRFTGSELWADPVACAEEVLLFMERA